MVTLWQILVQYIDRLTFGVALAMGLTPPRLVTSGFYRVHCWMLMGLQTVAALALFSNWASFHEGPGGAAWLFGLSIALTIASYVAAVFWLYEARRLGVAALLVIAAISLLAALLATSWVAQVGSDRLGWPHVFLRMLDLITGGMLVGLTLTAMLLGHWYLNAPGMQLAPLRWLVAGLLAAVAVRMVVGATGLALSVAEAGPPRGVFWSFIAVRWIFGLVGVAVLGVMTWWSLRVPNTQSATGILYAAFVLVSIGELTSLILSVDRLYPL